MCAILKHSGKLYTTYAFHCMLFLTILPLFLEDRDTLKVRVTRQDYEGINDLHPLILQLNTFHKLIKRVWVSVLNSRIMSSEGKPEQIYPATERPGQAQTGRDIEGPGFPLVAPTGKIMEYGTSAGRPDRKRD